MSNKKVCVLMSTYNGERFIKEQIESVLNQINIDIDIIIRDDGSSDNTVSIIKSLNKDNITIIEGENIGWKSSFCWLLRNSPEYEYYAFADQDDVWKPEKIYQAVNAIKDEHNACVYYCDATVVDENLKPVGIKKNYDEFENKLENIFVCSGQGCCMLLNNAAKKIFDEYVPQADFSHEAWICILCGYFGRIIHSNERLIDYRISNNNASGYGKTTKRKLVTNFFDSRFREKIYPPYARELLGGYSSRLSKEEFKELRDVVNYKKNFSSKIRLLKSSKVHRQTRLGTIGLKFAILLNLY